MDHHGSPSGYHQTPGQPVEALTQTHQYGYGHGHDNYSYGGASAGSSQQSPPAPFAQVPAHDAPAYQQHASLQQFYEKKPALPSFSGKKTSAWLKKNVSPRFTEVARSSIVQGSIKELSNAYTAAKGVADNYSARYYAQQQQHGGRPTSVQTSSPWDHHGTQPHPSGPYRPPPVSQTAPPWEHGPPTSSHSPPAATPGLGQPLVTSWEQPAQQSSGSPPAGQHAPVQSYSQGPAASPPAWGQQYGYAPTSPAPGQPSPSGPLSQTPAAAFPHAYPASGSTTSPCGQTPPVPVGDASTVTNDQQPRPSQPFASPQVQQIQAPPARVNEQPVFSTTPTPISRKPVGAPRAATTPSGAAPPVEPAPRADTPVDLRPPVETQNATSHLIIDHERKQSIRVITAPDGDRTFIREDYNGPAPDLRPVQPIASREEHMQGFAPLPRTYDDPLRAPAEYSPVPPPLFSSAPEPAPAEQPPAPGLLSQIVSAVTAAVGHTPSYRETDPLYDPLALATPVSTTGPGAPRLCPRQRTVSYATTWYHPGGLPDFGICSYCHSKYISKSPLAHEFDSVIKPKGACRFYVPRVAKSLWPEALRLSSIIPLRDFAARRTTIPACTKKGGAVGTDGVKWFGLARGEIGMVACEACHEDEVAGTSFAGRFEPLKQVQGASERWICTISYEHVSRCLQIFSASGDQDAAWAEFLAATGKRMALPDCSDTLSSATGRNWYRPLRPSGDLDFCEACYLDSLALTDLGAHFAETGESFEQKLCMRVCDFQLINLGEALYVCRIKGLGIDAFLSVAEKIAASPRCAKNAGITDGLFYNFAGTAAANFGICEGCHAGILVPHAVDHLFAPPQRVQGTAWCAFNPSVTRFGGLIDHWLEAIETGSWPSYERWVCKYAALPTCPNFNMEAGRRWYGWDDLPICPECYETVAEGTPLAASFELRDTAVEGERLCAAYSEHMRSRFRDAAAVGDAAGLREFNKFRMAVYAQTVPRFKVIAHMQTMQNQLALSQMMLGLSLQHADAMSGWGGTSGYEHGNSMLGYHQSQYGVDSAKAFDQGRATAARANGPVAEASYLKDVWQAVE